MENPTAPLQPQVVLTPNNQPSIGQKPIDKSSKSLFVVIIIVLVVVLIVTLAYFLVFNKSKKETQETKKESTNSAKTSVKKTSNIGYVTAPEGLNLREQPSIDSLKLLLLPAGTQVEIIGTESDWYYVSAQTKGYVSKEFITNQKPETTILKVFSETGSPFNFLYPSVYTIVFKNPSETIYEYGFTSFDSYGGFHIETETGFTTLGNYALKNYSGTKSTACSVQFANSRKECEQLETENGTLYLLLIDSTLYKISYLKTEGGALADINNLVFYSMFFKN